MPIPFSVCAELFATIYLNYFEDVGIAVCLQLSVAAIFVDFYNLVEFLVIFCLVLLLLLLHNSVALKIDTLSNTHVT